MRMAGVCDQLMKNAGGQSAGKYEFYFGEKTHKLCTC